jgi:hypothetical protein
LVDFRSLTQEPDARANAEFIDTGLQLVPKRAIPDNQHLVLWSTSDVSREGGQEVLMILRRRKPSNVEKDNLVVT